jgi:acetylornithine deacetylase/succinyl-diaminopimelate desuccinylase-like protein
MEGTATATETSALGADAVRLLQRLLRMDTVNPPGNERALQVELLELLADAGLECELLDREPERPNLVARLRGEADGPVLAYLGHVDTVPADPDEWTRDPWGGDVASGEVWGRGALDMKGQVAAEVVACAELARSGWRPPRGDLLLVITADEEMGAALGAQWLCAEHPDKVRCHLAVNEGAGSMVEFDGRRLYTLSVGEKGVFRFNLRTRGVAGHASIPTIGDNALLKIAPLLERLRSQPPLEDTEEARDFLSSLLGAEIGDFGEAIDRVREIHPHFAEFLAQPMLGVTLTPTKARASDKENVIPSRCEILVDCRVPPGMVEDEVRRRAEDVLGDGDFEIDFVERVVGNRSDFAGPLADAISNWVSESDPGAEVLPLVMPGFSDSHWFRKAFGATVFGFCPQRSMSMAEAIALIHGADERVPVADVDLATSFFFDLPRRLLR